MLGEVIEAANPEYILFVVIMVLYAGTAVYLNRYLKKQAGYNTNTSCFFTDTDKSVIDFSNTFLLLCRQIYRSLPKIEINRLESYSDLET